VTGVRDEDYLFDANEWKAFWLQAHLLPKSMLRMPSLSTLHRVPHGFMPPEWSASGTCGWALGYWKSGIILLGDRCLVLNRSNVHDQSEFFYEATTHEIAHRLSSWNFVTGQWGPATSLDQDPEFLALSNWGIEELVPQDGSRVVRRWKSGSNAKFVSLYAGTSPAEDFAESVGHFRTHPNESLNSTPEKYQFVKNRIFDHRGYTTAELKTEYADAVRSDLVTEVAGWMAPCLTKPVPVMPIDPGLAATAAMLKIDLPLDDGVRTCLQSQFANQVQIILDDLRYEEPEACGVLDQAQAEGDVIAFAAKAVSPQLTLYLKTDSGAAGLIQGVQTFRDAMKQDFDARSLLLSCVNAPSMEQCYSDKAKTEVQRLVDLHRRLIDGAGSDLLDSERDRFMDSNRFVEIHAQVTEFFERIFEKITDSVRTQAFQIWMACAEEPVTPVTGDLFVEPYEPGAGYLTPSMLNCLNVRASEQLLSIRKKAALEQGIDSFSPEAKIWIHQRILFPIFKSAFDSKRAEATKSESDQINGLQPGWIDQTYTDLIREQSGEFDLGQCNASAVGKLAALVPQAHYRYTAVDPAYAKWADEACSRVKVWSDRRQGFKTATGPVIPSDTQKGDISAIWPSFLAAALEVAKERFPECSKRIYFGQTAKRLCLFTFWVVDDQDQYRKTAWAWTKDRAVRKWVALPEVQAFALKNGYPVEVLTGVAKARAEDERTSISDSIVNAFFK
jgi:hypothetical protein